MNNNHSGKEPSAKTLDVLKGFARHEAMLHSGHRLFVSVMDWIMQNRAYKAFELIGRRKNCHKIACALASFFHQDERNPRIRKARGYDQLRKLVTGIIVSMKEEYHGDWPSNYERLIRILFTSQSLPEP